MKFYNTLEIKEVKIEGTEYFSLAILYKIFLNLIKGLSKIRPFIILSPLVP